MFLKNHLVAKTAIAYPFSLLSWDTVQPCFGNIMLSSTIKTLAAGILLFIALILLRDRRNIKGAIGATFMVSVALYVWCSIVHLTAVHNPLLLPLYAGCISVSFWFYLFSRSLFEDDFNPRAWHFLILIVMLALGYRRILFGESVDGEGAFYDLIRFIIQLGPALISILLIVLAIIHVYLGRSNDLVESRRKFRQVLILGTGGYAIVVTAVELWLQGSPASKTIDLIHSIAIAGLTVYVGQKAVILTSNAFEPIRSDVAALDSLDAQDTQSIDRLKKAMEVDQLFKEESLGIGKLANKLNIQEYRLRRLINGALGYRNFNDFLNSYRIAEAAKILAVDKELPILRVAMDLGFGSLAPFNRAFRTLKGMTPTEFRRNGRPGADQ